MGPVNRSRGSLACAVLALLLAGAVVCVPALAAGPPVTLAAYWERVQETRALLSLPDGAAGVDRAQLLAAADEWERIQEVLLPDGTRVPVDHSYLVALLRAEEPDLSRLDAHLSALLRTRDAWPPPGRDAPDNAALERILARPEFQWPPERVSPLARWIAQLRDRIRQWLLDPPWPGAVSLPGDALAVVAAAVLALVVWYVFRELASSLVPEAELGDAATGGGAPLTSASALKRAELLSKGNDYRTAVRFLYLSAILGLEERGLLRYDRSQTNREYLRSVAHLPQLAARLSRMIDVFERVWYGYHAVDAAAYARYEAWVIELGRYR
jgi:hypothetical protein